MAVITVDFIVRLPNPRSHTWPYINSFNLDRIRFRFPEVKARRVLSSLTRRLNDTHLPFIKVCKISFHVSQECHDSIAFSDRHDRAARFQV